MVVASKSAVSVRRRQAPSKAGAVADLHSEVISLKTRSVSPLWLRRLCYLHSHFCFVTFLLMTGLMAAYGWTVYSQQTWNQAYRKLETLQRHERQLTATSEVLKNQMALQAEQPAMRLEPSTPDKAIFLKPSPQRFGRTANLVLPNTQAAAKTAQPAQLPLGY